MRDQTDVFGRDEPVIRHKSFLSGTPKHSRMTKYTSGIILKTERTVAKWIEPHLLVEVVINEAPVEAYRPGDEQRLARPNFF